MTQLLPLRSALSGPRQAIPILRTSGDVILSKIGRINWRAREFPPGAMGELTESFYDTPHKGRITDYE